MTLLDRIRSLFGASPEHQRPGQPNPGRLMDRPNHDPHTDNPRAGNPTDPRPPLDEDVRPPVTRHRDN